MPEATRPPSSIPARPPNDSRRPVGFPTASEDAIEALSAASGSYAQESRRGQTPTGDGHGTGRGHKQRITLLFPALAAVAVGFVLLIAGRNIHLCGATFQLPEKLGPRQRDLCRNTLYEVVSADQSLPKNPRSDSGFFIDFPTSHTLRFAFASPKNPRALERARQLATGFLLQVEKKMRRLRQEPSESEVATSALISNLESALKAEQNSLRKALAEIPSVDHRAERDELLGRWKDARRKYDADHAQLSEVAGALEQLRDAPPPSRGIVTPEKRQNAYSADLGLEQDLKELAVALAEARGLIRDIQTETTPLQSQLNDAIEGLVNVLHAEESETLPKSSRERIARLRDEALALRSTFETFSTQWANQLSEIRESPIETRSHEFFDRYEQVRTTLSTFLFDSSKLLAKMRERATAPDAASDKRTSTTQSQGAISRSFLALQTLYHRFEFASSAINRSQNFRLDTALRRASGLSRRSQQRIRKIDEALQQDALERMKKSQADSVLQAEALLEKKRLENDQTVSSLVALQDRLTERVRSVEGFIAAKVRAETAGKNVETLQKTLSTSKKRLRELQMQRIAQGKMGKIKLIEAGILGPPINLGQRFRNGSIGAAITFLGVFLGQWWARRRT